MTFNNNNNVRILLNASREDTKKKNAQRQLFGFMNENSINPMSARTSFCVAYERTFPTIFFVSVQSICVIWTQRSPCMLIAHAARRTISSDIQGNMLFDRLEFSMYDYSWSIYIYILETAQGAPQSQFTPEPELKQK